MQPVPTMPQLRVPWHRSLGGKLFLFVSLCLLSAVGFISWQNSTMFGRFLDRQLEDHTVAEARVASIDVANSLESWAAQTAIVIHQATTADAAKVGASLAAFVAANKEIVAVQLVGAKGEEGFAFTPKSGDIRFEDAVVRRAETALRAFGLATVGRRGHGKEDFFVADARKTTKLPMLSLGLRFDRDGTPLWAVVTLWESRLLMALPKDAGTNGLLVTADGEPLVANGAVGIVGRARSEGRLFAVAARKLHAALGFKTFTGEGGAPRLGAYAQVPRFHLLTVVTHDARPGYRAIHQIILQTGLWAWVIFLAALMLSYVAVAGVTQNLKRVMAATLRIAGGDFSSGVATTSRDEVGVLGTVVNHMSSEIVSLLRSRIEQARQEKELETAKAVQDLLFPGERWETGRVKIAGKARVASECGGDWWGHFVTDDGLHVILIADATGHGAPAALVTALAYSCCTTLAETFRDPRVHGRSVAGILAAMNRLLWIAGKGQTTMTALAVLLDPVTGEMTYASTGHNMPYLVRNHAEPAPGQSTPKRAKVLRCRGMPLGFQETPDFQEQTLRLAPGDKLFLYTDGLVECANLEGKPWAKRRLETALNQLADGGADALLDGILTEAFTFFAGRPLEDDVTVVVVELLAAGAGRAAA